MAANNTLPPPTYLADEYNGNPAVAAAAAMWAIAACFVAMRLFTRGYLLRMLGISDALVVLGLFFSFLNSAGTIYMVKRGWLGRHTWVVLGDLAVWEQGSEAQYLASIVYVATLVSIKISILILYLRVLDAVYVRRVKIVIGLIGFAGFYSILGSTLICVPPEAFWDIWDHPDGRCWFTPGKWWTDIALHITGELIILFLPMPFIFSLDMPWRRRLGVLSVFGMGLVVISISTARIPVINSLDHSTDGCWDGVTSSVWNSCEVNMAIICACCMTIQPLFIWLFPKLCRARIPSPDIEGPHPPTIGTRRLRRLPMEEHSLALETIDEMAGTMIISKASASTFDTEATSTRMSPSTPRGQSPMFPASQV